MWNKRREEKWKKQRKWMSEEKERYENRTCSERQNEIKERNGNEGK